MIKSNPQTLQNLKDEVIQILSKFSNVDKHEIKPNLLIKNDLGIDSVDALDMLFILEKKFQVEISDKELLKFKYVDDIQKFVISKISKS